MKKNKGLSLLNAMLILIVACAAVVLVKVWHDKSVKAHAAAAQQEQAIRDQLKEQADRLAAEKAAFEKQVAQQNQRSEFDKAIQALESLNLKWKDADVLAASTGRIALATPVANLQALKRDVDALQVPDCLVEAKTSLSTGMDGIVRSELTLVWG